MRILSIGTFIDYEIQLANALCSKHEIMLVIPGNGLPDPYSGTIDRQVDVRLLYGGKPLYHYSSLFILNNFIKILWDFEPDVIHMQLGGGLIYLALLPFLNLIPWYLLFTTLSFISGKIVLLASSFDFGKENIQSNNRSRQNAQRTDDSRLPFV